MDLKKLLTKSFFERTLSAVALVVIALVTILLGGDVLYFTLLVVSLVGMFEFYRVFDVKTNLPGIIGYVGIVLYYMMLRMEMIEMLTPMIIIVLIALMAVYVFTFPKYKTEQIMSVLFGMMYVGVMLSFVYQVREMDGGIYHVWMIFLCSWISDTFAYLVGVTCGKHQMSPVLSPKKSVEGAIGGVAGSMLLGLIYAFVFRDALDTAIHPCILYPIVCGAGALISMVGDLAASAVKRNHNIKDYGHLIPGHGGVLDRFDSVIFTAPIIWILLQLFAN
ncbi:MAG: phosphatidate cytidylyltransferase [Lachnospiraceae bacterium]|nr:phosphatidate cytidylyltransferase [Lachnospiraceae bacterium]